MNYVYNEAKSSVPSTLVVSVFYCSPSNTFLRLLYERFFICMPLHKSLYKKLKLIFCTSVVLRTEPPDKPLIYFISLFLFQKSAKNVIGLHVFCLRATIPLQAQQYILTRCWGIPRHWSGGSFSSVTLCSKFKCVTSAGCQVF